jgi:hypothetical protein
MSAGMEGVGRECGRVSEAGNAELSTASGASLGRQ